MAHLGATELAILLAVLLLFFGAKKLPELARGSGQALRIFRKETAYEIEEPGTARAEGEPAH